MDTTTSALLTGIVVTGGQWANGKGITARIIFGAVVLAIMLTILSQANDKLAKQFSLLILVGAVLSYVPAIVGNSGIGAKTSGLGAAAAAAAKWKPSK